MAARSLEIVPVTAAATALSKLGGGVEVKKEATPLAVVGVGSLSRERLAKAGFCRSGRRTKTAASPALLDLDWVEGGARGQKNGSASSGRGRWGASWWATSKSWILWICSPKVRRKLSRVSGHHGWWGASWWATIKNLDFVDLVTGNSQNLWQGSITP